MHDETFYLDGVDARSVGIRLQSPVEFSEAVPIIEAQTIPGRNGDLIWETGSYENRSGEAVCFCLQKDVDRAISNAGRFLMGKKGYRRLETSDDPDHYWMARVENSPQIAMRVRTLAPFEIGFDCKPQRFVKSGEFPIYVDSSCYIHNPYGMEASPMIRVYGSGAGEIMVGDCTVELHDIIDGMILDSDTQNAYSHTSVNLNSTIYAPEFPVLKDGDNYISFSGGVERLEIIPRWWEL